LLKYIIEIKNQFFPFKTLGSGGNINDKDPNQSYNSQNVNKRYNNKFNQQQQSSNTQSGIFIFF